MDLLFREYADPFTFLDQVIPAGQLENFIEVFLKKRDKRIRWEFYIHKLSAWDERTWEEFNHDLDFGTAKRQEKPIVEEDIEVTVKRSYNIMKNFKLEVGD